MFAYSGAATFPTIQVILNFLIAFINIFINWYVFSFTVYTI